MKLTLPNGTVYEGTAEEIRIVTSVKEEIAIAPRTPRRRKVYSARRTRRCQMCGMLVDAGRSFCNACKKIRRKQYDRNYRLRKLAKN